MLLSHNFIKEVGENELIFNPQLIYSGKKEYYMGDMLEYSCSEFESCKPKRKYKIKEISDFKEITSKTYTGKSRYEIKPNIHFAKIKEDFLDYIYKYSSNKKILVLIQIMHQLFEDPEHIFIERNKFNVDKATLNAVTQYLHKNKIILKTKQLRGVYQINHDYLSSLPIRSYQNY